MLSDAIYSAAEIAATLPSPTALATCRGLPVQSPAANSGLYKMLIIAKDAYGCASLDSGNYKTIVKKGGKDCLVDPLDQIAATVGWKAWFNCKVLNPKWYAVVNFAALV